MNTESDIYKMTAKINNARKAAKAWDHPYEEKYVTDNFFAFQRGKFFVATTNSHNTQRITVPNTAFSDGEQICNIFWPSDCQTVKNSSVEVVLEDAEAKIYLPKTNSFFQDGFINEVEQQEIGNDDDQVVEKKQDFLQE